MTQYEVCKLFGEVYSKAATLDKATSGFRKAGIWPLNRGVFSDEDFAGSDNFLQHSMISDLSIVAAPAETSMTNTRNARIQLTEEELPIEQPGAYEQIPLRNLAANA